MDGVRKEESLIKDLKRSIPGGLSSSSVEFS
jgi:hypothetical protein